jgi:hypothetical protein
VLDTENRMHCLQYAVCNGRIAYNTHNMSDDSVRHRVLASKDDRIDRFNRCPECQQWSDVLSRDCPAKKVETKG